MVVLTLNLARTEGLGVSISSADKTVFSLTLPLTAAKDVIRYHVNNFNLLCITPGLTPFSAQVAPKSHSELTCVALLDATVWRVLCKA